jgi:hypothetical protein
VAWIFPPLAGKNKGTLCLNRCKKHGVAVVRIVSGYGTNIGKNPYPKPYCISSRFTRNPNFRAKKRRILRRQTWVWVIPTFAPSRTLKKFRSIGLFALTYPEHLGAAGWADTLSSGSAIFHGYFLGVLHFSFGFAFHTISFHLITSFNFHLIKSFAPQSL